MTTTDTEDAGKIATALGFLSSCIKSGEDWSQDCELAKNEAFDALARLTAQRHDVAELRAALEPFAKGAKEIPATWPDGRGFLIDEDHPDNPKKHCLLLAFVRDFRKAATVLQPPLAELEPHDYVPSAMHMGDCAVCGHLQGARIHKRRTKK